MWLEILDESAEWTEVFQSHRNVLLETSFLIWKELKTNNVNGRSKEKICGGKIVRKVTKNYEKALCLLMNETYNHKIILV